MGKMLTSFWRSRALKNYKLLAFFVGSFLLLLFATNVKSYILVFLVSFVILFFYFKYSLDQTVFLLLAMSIPFENNLREWVLPVTQLLHPNDFRSGYSYFFGVNLKLIFGLFLFLLLVGKKKLLEQKSSTDWILLAFFAIACLSTLYFFSTLPVLGLIRLWLSVFIYFSAKIFFTKYPKLFPIIISAIFIFATVIGVDQLIRQKPLGKFIELSPSFDQNTGYLTTDGLPQYRVASFISHPVYFGSFMSILLPIFIVYAMTINIPLAIQISLLGIITMLGSHSRSVWLTLALSFYLLLPRLKQKFRISRLYSKYKSLIFIFLGTAVILVISRLQSIAYLFTTNGNGTIRVELMKKSLEILAKYPFGVGLNRFTTALIDLPIPLNIRGFIFPVHNTILLITTELGILAGALFILFVIKSLFIYKIKAANKLVTYGAIIGAITFLVSSQFHPLFNIDPTFDLFMFTLGYINSQLCQS